MSNANSHSEKDLRTYRNRSATVSERTVFRRSMRKAPQDITEALIFKLKPIKEGYLIYKKKKRWVILDERSLYVFKKAEVSFF